MGKPKKFEIELNRDPLNKYETGEWITGNVSLELNEPIKTKGICLVIQGECRVKVELGSDNEEPDPKPAKETYFEHKIALHGKDRQDASDCDQMQTGSYVFPFKWQVFQGLPSSFQGQWGSIKYSMKAILNRNWKFDDTVTKEFTVICPLDLNQEPGAEVGDVKTVRKQYFTFHCCSKHETTTIKAEFSVERRGYVPKDKICMKVNISNNKKGIHKFEVGLYNSQHYHVGEYPYRAEQLLRRIEMGAVQASEEEHRFDGMWIMVPDLPPTHLYNCTFIEVKYFLKLTIHPNSENEFNIPLDIVIGTIPHRHVGLQQQTSPNTVCTTQPLSIHNPVWNTPVQNTPYTGPQTGEPMDLQKTRNNIRHDQPQSPFKPMTGMHETSVSSSSQGPAYQTTSQMSEEIPTGLTHKSAYQPKDSLSLTPVETSYNTSSRTYPSAPPLELAPPSYEESTSAYQWTA